METLQNEAPFTKADADNIVKLLGQHSSWVAHNSQFDWVNLQKQFLSPRVGAANAAERLRKLPPIDTVGLAKSVIQWNNGPGSSLKKLAEALNLQRHIPDTLHTA